MILERFNLRLVQTYSQIRATVKYHFDLFGPGGPFGPEPVFVLAPVSSMHPSEWLQLRQDEIAREAANEDDKSTLWDAVINWATPKYRTSIERRLRKKFGVARWTDGNKMIKPRFDLVTCETCGNYKEKKRLCQHCFDRVEEESKAIKEAIAKQFGLEAIEKPMVIRYKDDPKEEVTDKILVEVDKERPAWFGKNLLQRSHEVIPEKNVIVTDERTKN